MELGFTTAAYVVAAVLFILSLGGLSGQESAKRAVWYGIFGMALAVFATLIGPGSGLWALSVLLIAAGGVIGYFLAARVEMTQMPELVAGFHSLVGLAAVFIGINSAMLPHSDMNSTQYMIHNVEVFIGVFIGAITFTGSIVAFGKLSELITGKALILPGRHLLNLIMLQNNMEI